MGKKKEEEGPDPREMEKYLKEGKRICKDLESYGKSLEKVIGTAEELEKLAAEQSEQPSV